MQDLATLVKSVYTQVNKLTAPVGYNLNFTNIFLVNSDVLLPCRCYLGKISVLCNLMAHKIQLFCNGRINGLLRNFACVNIAH